jgi:hypothetical protein
MNQSDYHTYMHGNVTMKYPLYLFILYKQKCLFFKNGEQEGKTGPVYDLAPVGGEGYKERVRRVNVVKILCTHI